MSLNERIEIEARLREASDRIDRLERAVLDWLALPTVGERLAEFTSGE